MKEGDNRVMFKLIGKNDKSTGHGLDLYRIIFEKEFDENKAQERRAAGWRSCSAPCLLLTIQHASLAQNRPRLTSYVDPFVGVDGDGNTVPGAAVPFGFSNPSPDTVPNADPGRFDTSGYESDKPIIGFSQTHVSGTGGESKYGNFRVTPQIGPVDLKEFASPKRDEVAEPGYYAVTLTKPDVRAELTTTRLVAVHRYTFPAGKEAHLILDTGSVVFTGGGAGRRQRPVATRTSVVAPDRVEGTGNFIGGWNPSPYTLHFSAEFSRPFKSTGLGAGTSCTRGRPASLASRRARAHTSPSTRRPATGRSQNRPLISSASRRPVENLLRETGGAGFDEIRRRAASLWEQALPKSRSRAGATTSAASFTRRFTARTTCRTT